MRGGADPPPEDLQVIGLCKAGGVRAAMAEALDGLRYAIVGSRASLLEAIGGASVLVTSRAGAPRAAVDQEVLQAAGPLRLIQQFGASTDGIDLAEASRRGIPVAIVPGANAVAVAELALHLMLCLARRHPSAQGALRAGLLGEPVGTELSGKRLCIIGFGRVGTCLAIRAKALGMQVAAVDRTPLWGQAGAVGVTVRVGRAGLLDGLATADYVVVSAPLLEETLGLLGPAELARLKPGAKLVNVARAELIDERALRAALEAGRLGGFAADVAWQEPIDPSDALLDREDVVLTPHLGGATEEALRLTARLVRENIDRILRGELPHDVVNAGIGRA
jgi:phosphoglycerate dehydrogenase-like enzyme